MTKAKENLSNVLDIVSRECEVEAGKILSRCSEAEVVDARWICVRLLRERGYYPSRIAEMMRITPRYVQYILTDFEDKVRCNVSLRMAYNRVLRSFTPNHQNCRPDFY